MIAEEEERPRGVVGSFKNNAPVLFINIPTVIKNSKGFW